MIRHVPVVRRPATQRVTRSMPHVRLFSATHRSPPLVMFLCRTNYGKGNYRWIAARATPKGSAERTTLSWNQPAFHAAEGTEPDLCRRDGRIAPAPTV